MRKLEPAPSSRATYNAHQMATGGRSEAADADAAKLKNEVYPKNLYLSRHVRSITEQREGHSEDWPQVLDAPQGHTCQQNLKSAGRKAVGVQIPLWAPSLHQ